MSSIAITGAAGFIGSHVTNALMIAGWHVRGIDAFTLTYDPEQKRDNPTDLADPRFELVEADLGTADVDALLDGVDADRDWPASGDVGEPIVVEQQPGGPGDVARTEGDAGAAARGLGWRPRTDLRTGLTRQISWHRDRRAGRDSGVAGGAALAEARRG